MHLVPIFFYGTIFGDIKRWNVKPFFIFQLSYN